MVTPAIRVFFPLIGLNIAKLLYAATYGYRQP